MNVLRRTYDAGKNFYRKHKFIIRLAIILFVSAVLICGGMLRICSGEAYDEVFAETEEGDVTDALQDGDVLTQEFRFSNVEYLQGIALLLKTDGTAVLDGSLSVQLFDDQGNVIVEKEIPASDILNRQYMDILFGGDMTEINADQTYLLRLTVTGVAGETLACYLSEDDEDGAYTLDINGEGQSTDLVIYGVYSGDDLFSRSYMIFAVCFIALIIVIYFMLCKWKLPLWKIYIPAGIFLGVLYLIIIPVYAVPDEPAHINSAYKISNIMLGIEDPEDGSILMRQEDVSNGFSSTGIDREYYNTYFKNFGQLSAVDETLVQTQNQPVSAPVYLYFFSAVGMTLGRVMHLGSIYIYLLGRVFNMIIFVLLMAYAIKKIPFGKAVLFVWALLPMTLQQAGSFSYDSLLLALSMVIISLSVYFAFGETATAKRPDWAMLLIGCALVAPAKGYAWIPVCLLPVIIYLKKRRELKKLTWYMLGLAGAMCLSILIFKFVPAFTFAEYSAPSTGNTDGIVVWANEAGYTLDYLIAHPKTVIVLLFSTIYVFGDQYLGTFLGNSLGWFEMDVPLIAVLPFLFLLILAGMKKQEEPVYMGRGMKLYFCFLALVGIGLSFAGMLLAWTPMSYGYILGVQGRYFLPFVPLLFLSVRSKNITVNQSVMKKVVFVSVWLELVVFVLLYLRA